MNLYMLFIYVNWFIYINIHKLISIHLHTANKILCFRFQSVGIFCFQFFYIYWSPSLLTSPNLLMVWPKLLLARWQHVIRYSTTPHSSVVSNTSPTEIFNFSKNKFFLKKNCLPEKDTFSQETGNIFVWPNINWQIKLIIDLKTIM